MHSCMVRPSAASFNTVFATLGSVATAVGELDKQVLAARWVRQRHVQLCARTCSSVRDCAASSLTACLRRKAR